MMTRDAARPIPPVAHSGFLSLPPRRTGTTVTTGRRRVAAGRRGSMATGADLFRTLTCLLVAILGTWVGGVRVAEASCGASRIQVVVRLAVFPSDVIPVTWYVDPACAVVETGLLLGPEPTALVPVGQPIYGARDHYAQDIPVSESGRYWVAAYARDEGGERVQSAAHPVFVVVPPRPLDDSRRAPAPSAIHLSGAHGPLPSYTGTDADFVQPAGNPHYASLRAATMLNQGTITPFVTFFVTQRRLSFIERGVSSTDRNDVQTKQLHPFLIDGVSVPVAPPEVLLRLDQIDQVFGLLRFPRVGLYTVTCFGNVFQQAGGGFSSCVGDTGLQGPAQGYSEYVATRELEFGRETRTFSQRTTATFVIPKAPAGQRVQRARLRIHIVSTGEPAAIRLNGKAPTAIDTVSCGTVCSAWATWDFTAEARVLAEQGGGELVLTPDSIPATVIDVPGGFTLRGASYAFGLAANYPWRHGTENKALTLTFEADCPKALTLTVTPSAVRPSLPTRLRPGMTSLPVTATVDAMVKTCPAPGETPAPVEVIFEVRPPAAGSADEGGHLHTNRPRPTGALQDIDRGQATNRCTVTTFTDGTGSCMIEYHGGEVSGVEAIVARAPGFTDAEAKVTVKAPSLLNLATSQSSLAHAFRLTGVTAHHDDNHWGTRHTIDSALLVAKDYLERFSATLNINDMSLISGGMFDIDGDWNIRPKPFHKLHRQGTSVDIESCAVSAILDNPNDRGTCGSGILVPKPFIGRRCLRRGQGWLEKEASIHCEFPR